MGLPLGLILGYLGAAGDIPAGWARLAAADDRYLRGAAASGGTGGAANHSHATTGHYHSIAAHTHTVSGTSGDPIDGQLVDVRAGVGSPPPPTVYDGTSAHTHDVSGASSSVADNVGTAYPASGDASNDPPHLTVIWIRSDGTPTTVPLDALAWTDGATPPAWTWHADAKGKFLKGAPAASNGGATAGDLNHSHTWVGAHTGTAGDHTHSGPISDDTTSPASMAMLTAGSLLDRPRFVDGTGEERRVESRRLLQLKLVFDHRPFNGSHAASFLRTIKHNLEHLNLQEFLASEA